jgi:hypothetical protein
MGEFRYGQRTNHDAHLAGSKEARRCLGYKKYFGRS